MTSAAHRTYAGLVSDTAGPFLEIAVEVAGIDAELAADVLRQGCPGGVAIEAPSRLDPELDAYVLDGDAPALVKGYLPAGPEALRLQRSLKLALQSAPLQRDARWRRARRLREADWRESWKKYFGVQRIGRRIIIVPSWIEFSPRPEHLVITIDPGMAFGTGQHPTTAMCLRALEEHVRPGLSVLDLGCGSGILAIAAAKLGASTVLALDTDPLAVKACRENAQANGVTVEVREGTLPLPAPPFDVVVANISGLALERLAGAVADALREGGVLIASGFLDDRVMALSGAFAAAGLAPQSVAEDGVWRAIVARRAHG
jgi:ribosomal protein L11 methyltransferase